MMCSAVALLGAIVLASSVGRWSAVVFAVVTLGLILEAIDERRLYQRRRMAGNY